MHPVYSVIVPCYNEEAVIRETHKRLTQVMSGMGEAYEIVYVNDGSRDQTPVILRQLAAEDSHVRAVITAADRSGTIITNDCVCTDGVEIAEKNFEDPVFRQYLSDKYDTDQNGILSDAEIEKIQEIRLDDARDNGKYKAVVSLQGASKLWNVTGVIASNTAISSFDGKNMDRLTVLHLENCPLDSLIVKDNKRLKNC